MNLAQIRQPTVQVDDLDAEVREDVELAAEVHARDAKVPLLPSPAAGKEEPPPPLPAAPLVPRGRFVELMEAALLMRRGPRAYLVPSPSKVWQSVLSPSTCQN